MANYDDFIGFTFNGIHSSELGIYHVSDGSRYKENLLPSFSDRTVQVPGRDGTLLFGTDNQKIELSLAIAFDNVNEQQLLKLKNIFNDKKVHPLIFDEMPYKAYYVKCVSAPTLNYVCFDDYSSQEEKYRVYKGEGTLQFVCYEGFARSTINFAEEIYQQPDEDESETNDEETLEPVPKQEYINYKEWKDQLGLLESKSQWTQVASDSEEYYEYQLKSCGDFDSPLKLNYSLSDWSGAFEEELTLGDTKFSFNIPAGQLADISYIEIDSELRLIRSYSFDDDNNKVYDKKVYNKYITHGNFLILPRKNIDATEINLQKTSSLVPEVTFEYRFI